MNKRIETIFDEDELSVMMVALSGYMTMKRNQKRSTEMERELFNKLVESLLVYNKPNEVEIDIAPMVGRMGVAEYKMAEAMGLA
jgi:acetamidase/formamidase